jgi:hypothetical protein
MDHMVAELMKISLNNQIQVRDTCVDHMKAVYTVDP